MLTWSSRFAELEGFNLQENIMVLINHIDTIPKADSADARREEQMIISTAQDFLNGTEKQQTSRVFPTSAFQGLCNLQMNRLIEQIEKIENPEIREESDSPSDSDSDSEGDGDGQDDDTDTGAGSKLSKKVLDKWRGKEILRHMNKEDPVSSFWMDDWITQAFGLDGFDEKELPKPENLLKTIRAKNEKRWGMSRLEKPLGIVFNAWAGKVACENLYTSVEQLRPAFHLEREFKTMFKVSKQKDEKIDEIIAHENDQRIRVQARHRIDLQGHDRDIDELKRQVNGLTAMGKRWLTIMITEEDSEQRKEAGWQAYCKTMDWTVDQTLSVTARGFVADKAQDRPDMSERGWFQKPNLTDKAKNASGSTVYLGDKTKEEVSQLDNVEEDHKVYYGNEEERDKVRKEYHTAFSEALDEQINRFNLLIDAKIKEFDAKFNDAIDDCAVGGSAAVGSEAFKQLDEKVAQDRSHLFLSRWTKAAAAGAGVTGFAVVATGTGAAAATWLTSLAVIGTVTTGGVLGIAIAGVGAASGVAAFASSRKKERWAVGANKLQTLSVESGNEALNGWAAATDDWVKKYARNRTKAFKAAQSAELQDLADKIESLQQKKKQQDSQKEACARTSAACLGYIRPVNNEFADVSRLCKFVQANTNTELGDCQEQETVTCPAGKSGHIYIANGSTSMNEAKLISRHLETVGYEVCRNTGDFRDDCNDLEALQIAALNTPVAVVILNTRENLKDLQGNSALANDVRRAQHMKKLIITVFASEPIYPIVFPNEHATDEGIPIRDTVTTVLEQYYSEMSFYNHVHDDEMLALAVPIMAQAIHNAITTKYEKDPKRLEDVVGYGGSLPQMVLEPSENADGIESWELVGEPVKSRAALTAFHEVAGASHEVDALQQGLDELTRDIKAQKTALFLRSKQLPPALEARSRTAREDLQQAEARLQEYKSRYSECLMPLQHRLELTPLMPQTVEIISKSTSCAQLHSFKKYTAKTETMHPSLDAFFRANRGVVVVEYEPTGKYPTAIPAKTGDAVEVFSAQEGTELRYPT